MRVTIRTSLALRTLMACAANQGKTLRKHDVADLCEASENHLAQVIYQLAKHNYITTRRGRSGGMTLARPPEQITVGDVFRTFEAPLPFADCFARNGAKAGEKAHDCNLAGPCRLPCIFAEALAAFYARLDQSTLADLMVNNAELDALLRLPAAA